MSMETTGNRLIRPEQRLERVDFKLVVGSLAAKSTPTDNKERTAIAEKTFPAICHSMISLSA